VHLRERQTPLPTHWAKLGRQRIFQGGAVNDNHKKKKARKEKKEMMGHLSLQGDGFEQAESFLQLSAWLFSRAAA